MVLIKHLGSFLQWLCCIGTTGVPAHIDVGQAEPDGGAEEEVRQPRDPALGDRHQAPGCRPVHSAGNGVTSSRVEQNRIQEHSI